MSLENEMSKPMVIVFEGGPYSGKGEHQKSVALELAAMRIPYVVTQEPGDCLRAKPQWIKLVSDAGELLSAEEKFGLVTQARTFHLEDTILPAFRAGKVVLIKGFDYSTWANQICGEECHSLEEPFFRFRKEHLEPLGLSLRYLTFDVSLPVAESRMRADQSRKRNHFDLAAKSYQNKVRNGFVAIAQRYGTPVINTERSMEEVDREVMRYLIEWGVFG